MILHLQHPVIDLSQKKNQILLFRSLSRPTCVETFKRLLNNQLWNFDDTSYVASLHLLWFHLISSALISWFYFFRLFHVVLISLFMNFCYKNTSKIIGSLVFDFLGQPNHEKSRKLVPYKYVKIGSLQSLTRSTLYKRFLTTSQEPAVGIWRIFIRSILALHSCQVCLNWVVRVI